MQAAAGGRRRSGLASWEEQASQDDQKAQADPTSPRWTKAELVGIAHSRPVEPEPDEEPPEPPRRLSVAEQDAFMRGLTGPARWEDTEALNARREARRRERFSL